VQDKSQPSPLNTPVTRSALPVGVPAPDFQLEAVPGQIVTLGELRGRRVALAFYAGDWYPHSIDQLTQLQDLLSEFAGFDVALLAISVDSAWCHRAFTRHHQFGFALLADFEPKGAVAQAYGVYWNNAGHSRAALFLIDRRGVIAWSHIAPADAIPDIPGILSALAGLSEDEERKP
jgi:peroxiredoxin